MRHIGTEVESEGDVYWDQENPIPATVTFQVDPDRIRHLGGMVRSQGLYKVELFDFSPDWAPDTRTEMTTLNVTADEFWFAAVLKHTDIALRSKRLRIADL